MSNNKIFISKGSAATQQQRQFIDAILDILSTVGFSPRIMNENEWSHEQPLKAIRKIIKECNGTVIIAFTRTAFERGIEYKKDRENEIQNISLPTTWNHIEGSLAYAYGMPLFIIAENGLKSEGLIEKGYDWTVYWSDLNPDIVKSDSFKGFLSSWKSAVEEYAQNKDSMNKNNFSPEKITLGYILNSLTIPQIWKLISAIVTTLIAIATIAYKIGGGKFPWD